MSEISFWDFAQSQPEHKVLVEPDGTIISAGALLSRANQVVHGLRSLGLNHGDCVAAVLPNGADIVELFMGAAQAGLYLTPINGHLTASEIAYIIRDSRAKAVVTAPRYANKVNTALQELDFEKTAKFCSGESQLPLRAWQAFLDEQTNTRPENRTAGGPMTYTSGTTGNPKGVRRALFEVAPEVASNQQAMFLMLFGIMPGSACVHLVSAPLYHTAVLNFATNHLHLGHTLVLMDKWDAEGMLQLIEKHRVNSSHMVPTQLIRLLKLPEDVREKYDVSSLSHMIHSAAPCPIETKNAMLKWWGPCLYEYYAASEGGGTLVGPDEWLKKPGTVGKPWPISEIRILNEDLHPCPTNDVGTVWIRMGEHTFKYHGDKQKTDKAWHEGFFTVGDAGYLDEDGYLFLCDRKADMIISGGVNIYPAEIEAVLINHKKVADVAVFGIPDEDWGEQVKSVVQLMDGGQGSDELSAEILEFALKKLAKFKCPKSIDYITQMPRDPNGKLYKRKLRAPYWDNQRA